MRGLAVKGNGVPLNTESSEDGPERAIEIEKDGALFDVELEIGGGVLELPAAVLHLFEIDPVLGERGRKRDALLVLQGAGFIHVEMAGACGRTEQALAKTRP